MAMMKKTLACCCLLALLLAFGGVASANAPYASIMAFTQNNYNNDGDNPIMNILAKLNIINLTPWEIYIGNPNDPNPNGIMQGFSGPPITTSTQTTLNPKKSPITSSTQLPPVLPFWLKGINGVNDSSNQGQTATGADGFAFHSLQIGLNNPNNSWLQPNSPAGQNRQYNPEAINISNQAQASGHLQGPYAAYTAYLPIPIVFNSSTGKQGQGNTVSLNFMITSSLAFAMLAGTYADHYGPALALGLGSGNGNTINAWVTQATGTTEESSSQSNNTYNVSQFLTLQGTGATANNWYPVPTANGGLSTPSFLNTAALAYPNFSSPTLSGVAAVAGIDYDLVVMLQSGDYADLSLIFLAVPSSSSSAVKRK